MVRRWCAASSCAFASVMLISIDLIHFCWRERNVPLDQPEIDLVMVPTDGHFVPYEYKTTDQPTSQTNGRIFVLKFSSSSARHLFWLQSKPQAPNGDASWFSPRDLKIGQIVDNLLQGEDVDVVSEMATAQGERDDDGDETMEDVQGHGDSTDHQHGGSGGAGADATGGDIREEGSSAREGGADGGRA